MNFFAVAFSPSDEFFVPLHRSRLKEGCLNVEVTGQLLDKTSGDLRPFYAEHPMFPNPGSYNEIVVGGGDEYVVLTKGTRSGMIVWTKYARPQEEPEPVSRFFWLDDRPDDDPAVQEAQLLRELAEEVNPQRHVEWPAVYARYERHRFPTGIRDDGARRLYKIDVPEITEGLSEAQMETAQREIAMAVGPGHSLTEEVNVALWTEMRHEGGNLMIPTDYIQVHKNTPLFARVTDQTVVQKVVQKHELYTEPLKGKRGQIRYSLV